MGSAASAPTKPQKVDGWLPQTYQTLESWITKKTAEVEDEKERPFHPVIQEFQQLIEEDAEIFMGFHQMFEQIPRRKPYHNDPTGRPQVRDYKKMLALFNRLITQAPEYNANMLVAVPFTAILEWPMGTAAGIATFMNPKVNAMFKKMFDVWATFLVTPESCYVLHTGDNGWLGPAASKSMPDFAETFVCDASAPYHGYTSWDNFFTRSIRPGSRPIECPDDNSILSNACESTAYRLAHNVKTHDSFWVKGQPYSLFHMLDNDPFAPRFANGTVYQGFLNPFDYHRWHSPVDGQIVKTVSVPGTYFAESPAFGFANPAGPDALGPSGSQAFVTAVATRMLVFIEADNPRIGLMCFMAVGMTEVSTCEINVNVGDRVKKGDQMGMFHFGGSSHCLVFRPETKIKFNPKYPIGSHIPLNVAIASVEL